METTMEMTDRTRRGELLDRFKELSIRHYQASEEGDYKTVNEGVGAMEQVVRELWTTGGRTKEALKGLSELSKDSDPRIAIKAVTYTVELFPEVAGELNRLAREKSLVGLAAKYAIKNVESGKTGVLSSILGALR
jgi:hypothetical protein